MDNILRPHWLLLTFQQMFASWEGVRGVVHEESFKNAEGAHDNTKVDDHRFRGSWTIFQTLFFLDDATHNIQLAS